MRSRSSVLRLRSLSLACACSRVIRVQPSVSNHREDHLYDVDHNIHLNVSLNI